MVASDGTDITQSQTWLLDSRASHHLTSDVSRVSNSTHFVGNEGITTGNGNQLPISSVGYRALHANNDTCLLSLKNVLHAPHVSSNLLSVQKQCNDNQVPNEFHSDTFVVKYINSGHVILNGYSDNGLTNSMEK